jgi:hypothetical protein
LASAFLRSDCIFAICALVAIITPGIRSHEGL